jgi:hypothetical protein
LVWRSALVAIIAAAMPASRGEMGPVPRPVTTVCCAGHPRTDANTRRTATGAQVCTICDRRAHREFRARKQALRHDLCGTVALITWAWTKRDPTPRASWRWFSTRERAAAAAPTDGQPVTIVDVAVKPWRNLPDIFELVRRNRPLEQQRKWTVGI